jgi:hypothetical protein
VGNLADLIAALFVERQVEMNSLAADHFRRIAEFMLDLERDINAKLAGDLTTFQKARVDQVVRELQQTAQQLIAEYGSELRGELPRLAQQEAQYAVTAVNGTVGVDLVRILPTTSLATLADAQTVLMQGATIGEWFGRTSGDTQFRIASAVRLGLAQGETAKQVAARLKGVVEVSKDNLLATTITAIQTVTGKVHEQTWLANADVIDAVQQLSTLDSKTSDVCISYSGKVWSLPDFKPRGHNLPYNGGVPRHFRCRSRGIPLVKKASEIGGIDLPVGTRASMDGQVAADLSFDAWLKAKPRGFVDGMLGEGRAQLFLDGKITLTDLISPKTLKPRTLEQLRQL